MNDKYVSPFSSRYASKEMQYIFSQDMKFRTFRKLWITLAKAEKDLGLDISNEQIEEMQKYQDNINYEDANLKEQEICHDVMAHIYAFGLQCPKAKPIIHLGATSCYVGDNTDIIIMHKAMKLLKEKILKLIHVLCEFAFKYKDLPIQAYTHFQAAQPTTLGKRTTLWIQDLVLDFEDIIYFIDNIKLLGCKGTTGTQASFMKLFDGDYSKVKKLDALIANYMGFSECFEVSGQTYTRKLDSKALNILSGIAQSCAKFSNDIRLMQHLKEVEEPFENKQVGSSAMAYKRNPVRSERMAAIARYVMIDSLNPAITQASQWFERTLDDSANKRISVSEAFLATDALLELYINIASGLVVYPKVIESNLNKEMPFMATENIMMDCVKLGADRQTIHELIRKHSMEASRLIKESGEENKLLSFLADDNNIPLSREQLLTLTDAKSYTGCAEQQTEEFVKSVKESILKDYKTSEYKDSVNL